MRMSVFLRYVSAGLFCIVSFLGLLSVFTGKVDLGLFSRGFYGNLVLPLYTIAVPALLALALVLRKPVLGIVGGALGLAFYVFRLSVSLPMFLKNIQMTYMSHGVASIDSVLCILSFLLVILAFLSLMKTKRGFGFGLPAFIFRTLSFVLTFAFSCIMSLNANKNISKFTFYYPQMKLTGIKSYHVMIGGVDFMAQDLLLVLAFALMAFAIRGMGREKEV